MKISQSSSAPEFVATQLARYQGSTIPHQNAVPAENYCDGNKVSAFYRPAQLPG